MAHRHDAPREADGTGCLQIVLRRIRQALDQRARPVRDRIPGAERIEAASAQCLELVATMPLLLVQIGFGHASRPRDHKRYALTNSSRSPSMTASTLPISTPVRVSLMRCSG